MAGMALSRHFEVWNVVLHDRCKISDTLDLCGRRGTFWALLKRWQVAGLVTCARATISALCVGQIALVVARC